MANEKISAMTAATALGAADLIPIVQSGVNKSAVVSLIVAFPPLASAPGSPTTGQGYYDTTLHGASIYGDDAAWHELVTT